MIIIHLNYKFSYLLLLEGFDTTVALTGAVPFTPIDCSLVFDIISRKTILRVSYEKESTT